MPYENYQRWKSEPVAAEPLLSIVIPAYNEEARILPAVGSIASFVSDQGFAWELIVADDGSRDSTVRLLEDAKLANLRILPAEKNTGKGDAVRRGMLAAHGQYVLFADADNSTPIEQVKLLMDPLVTGEFDVAIGGRLSLDSNVQNKSAFRKLLSWGLHVVVKAILRVPVRDTQCGFKMFTRESAQRLFSAQTIEGFSFDLEILFLAYRLGYRVIETPVTWFDAPGSKVNARREVKRFLSDIFFIRLNAMKGVYRDV